ncbi:MAG: deoxyribose-phosphate aldolase [Bacteroidota bacterium]
MSGLTPQHVEYTNLKPDVTHTDIDQLVATAIERRYYGICVPPFWVKRARREIGNANVRLVTVAGYPVGYQMTETKEAEIRAAIDLGADEIDMVLNVSAVKSGMSWVKIEMARCAKLAHDQERMLKVILETSLLDDDEIRQVTRWAVDAGVDFIKTSTGMIGEGATVKDVALIKSIIPSGVGIKASGGIRTSEQADDLIAAGAEKIGTSSILI